MAALCLCTSQLKHSLLQTRDRQGDLTKALIKLYQKPQPLGNTLRSNSPVPGVELARGLKKNQSPRLDQEQNIAKAMFKI